MRYFVLPALISVLVASSVGAQKPPPPNGGGGPIGDNALVTITVNANNNRHAISPLIYGSAFASDVDMTALNLPLHRMGGNNTSRYNWLVNGDNRGNDWYYQCIPDDSPTPGERGDSFIQHSRAGGAEPMVTIPMVGYVAKLGPNRSKLSSYSISKYGAQTGSDWQWFPDAGNGIRSSDNAEITWNDPLDANVPADHTFQQGWVSHIVSTWGAASVGGLKYYLYDNESSIWHGTHRDVHPTGASMEEIRDKIFAYGTMIHNLDPTSLLVGPEEWGWSGYLYSGYDQWWGAHNGWGNLPDRAAHGNMDYLPWLLAQIKQHEISTGVRLLDVFTVHYYPQGGEFWSGTDTAMQLRRNRSTRSLWDPNYVDETWVNDKVRLIPRIREWANTYYYPQIKTGITEYNWGAEDHINGATTQADIYGIFGRENLDMGARWGTPGPNTPTYKAMKMYRNYDGNKNGFGDTSVSATTTSNVNDVSTFSAVRANDGALTVMVVAKVLSGATPVTVNLSNYAGGASAQVWQLTSANTLTQLSNVAVSGNSLSLSVPAQSVTMVIVPPAPTGLVKIPSLTLEKFTGDITTRTVTVEIRTPGSTTPLETVTGSLLSPGAYYFNTTRRGTFDVAIKGANVLRKRFAGVSITTSGATLPAVKLIGGDANGDNVVNTTDTSIVQKAMRSRPGNPTWDVRADLNGDGVITTADLDLTRVNVRKRGDL